MRQNLTDLEKIVSLRADAAWQGIRRIRDDIGRLERARDDVSQAQPDQLPAELWQAMARQAAEQRQTIRLKLTEARRVLAASEKNYALWCARRDVVADLIRDADRERRRVDELKRMSADLLSDDIRDQDV